MDAVQTVEVAGKSIAGLFALAIAVLVLVVGDAGAWNTRLALFLMAFIPGALLLNQVRRTVRE